jgi:hypothetical protein
MCVGIMLVSCACCQYQRADPQGLNYGVPADSVLMECDGLLIQFLWNVTIWWFSSYGM